MNSNNVNIVTVPVSSTETRLPTVPITNDTEIAEAVEQALVDDILDDTILVADEIVDTNQRRYLFNKKNHNELIYN